MTDGTGTTTRTYDALNRTTSKTVPYIGTSFYVYDITADMDAGCTAETSTDPKGNITLKVYDPLGRLSRVTADGMTSTYTYYDNGSLQTVLYGDGSREDYTFTSDNLLQTLINRKADNTIIDSYAYTYDAAHNLLTKTDSRGITSYTYDVLNRLSSVTEPSGKVTSYTYDASGNRATQTVVLGTETTVTTYTYDPLNRLLGTVTQLNGITTETVTYTYDNNGNQLLQTHTAYIDGIPQTPIVKLTNTYDLFNQLITTVTSDGVTVISTYNGDGLRVGKSVNGTLTRYLYEYDKVVLEVNVLGDQTGRNVYGINLLTRQVGVDTFIYMYNGHADVTALLNTAGTIVATYYYDAFGNILDQTGVLSNNILYAGYQYDSETGLYYLNARMYDPVTARFMQEDTFTGDRNDPLSLNLYTYCHNEPLMYSDPTGHNWWSDLLEAAQDGLDAVVDTGKKVLDTGKKVLNTAVDVGKQVVGAFFDAGKQTANTVANEGKKILKTAGNIANSAAKSVVSWGKDTIEKGKKELAKFSVDIKKNITAVAKGVMKKAPEVMDAAIDFVSDSIENSYNNTMAIAPYTRIAMEISTELNPLYWAFDFVTEQGLCPGGFDAGGFYMDDKGIYHAKQSGSIQSLEGIGYNNFFDAVFNCSTSMNQIQFQFESGGKEYKIEAWKGDYLNLGAGAELGIYENFEVNGNPTSHWLVNQDLAMPMTMNLDYKGKQIISYDPKKDDNYRTVGQGINKWWVTGFDPKIENAKAEDLTATYTLDFSNQTDLYDDFIKSEDYIKNTDKWSVSEENKYLLTLTYK